MGSFTSKSERKPQYPTVKSDRIIPLHRYDGTSINRKVIVEIMMRFDDVLDPQKLRSSLERLLERDDWRKLGARLRLNRYGKLVYHVPVSYNEKRPSVAYSHLQVDTEINNDPLGARLPRPTAKPAVLNDPEEFAPFIRRPDAPRSLDDYLTNDAPQLSLHIVSFTDATIVSLSWPHTLLDAMGRKELLTAWVAMLEGRDEDVRPLYGLTEDPLKTLGSNPKEPYLLADRQLSYFKVTLFAMRYYWETWFWHRGEETRMISIPAAHVKYLHDGAMAELAAQSNGSGDVKPFVSEGDVVCAWVTRLALQHLKGSDRTVTIANALGMRGVLADDLLPPNFAYVGNAVAGVYGHLRTKDLFSKSLVFTASVVRRSIAEQGTRAQLEARAAINRKMAKQSQTALFGDVMMQPVLFSNWSKGRFFDTDFSAAVLRPGANLETRANKLGRPSYIQPSGNVQKLPTRNSFPIVGKDAEGNYWIAGTLGSGLWSRVQAAMDLDTRTRLRHEARQALMHTKAVGEIKITTKPCYI